MKQQHNRSKRIKQQNSNQIQKHLSKTNNSFWGKLCPCFSQKKKIDTQNSIVKDQKSISYIEHNQQTHSNFPISEQSDFITTIYQQKNIIKNTNEPFLQKQKPNLIQKNIPPEKRITTQTTNSGLKSKLKQHLYSIQSKIQSMNLSEDYNYMQGFKSQLQSQYSVNKITQNKLILIGNHKARLLSKVTSVIIYPYPSAVQKQKQSRKNNKKKSKKLNSNEVISKQIDKYWDKRYFLFQKFDQGIQLDEQSWYSVTPESVADYIASKIHFNGVILDAFCGAGGDSIKLSFASKKVISNDIDPIKIQCLINNAKIYGADNISVNCSDFFDISQKVDAVYLAPPWGGPEYFQKTDFYPEDFVPSLQKIFQKSLTLSSNLFFLLPANTNIEQLSACLSRQLLSSKQIYNTCTIKIEKIYFNDRLKFIAGYFGELIQTQVKINEELDFMYNLLREPQEGIFKHKKVLRKLRQQFGMVKLLNLIFQCQKISNQNINFDENGQKPLMDHLYQYIRKNQLIGSQKLQKLIKEQETQYETLKQRYKQKKQKKIQKYQKKYNNFIQNEEEPKIQQSINQLKQNDVKHNNQEFYQNISNAASLKGSFDISQMNNSKNSKISSFGQQDMERTLSYVSELTEDQLQQAMIMNSMNRPQSQYSVRQSLDYFKRFDSLQVSAQMRKSQQGRFSSPLYVSPQKAKMDKKQCSYWEEGISQISQQKQKDFQQQ